MTTLEVDESVKMNDLESEGNCNVNASDGSVEKDGDDKSLQRETWSGEFEFVLSLIGYTVGLGNIWRFPYFVYRNGGGVAIIPYLIFLFTCGGPLYYMEVCLGQFSGKSPVGIWDICPLFRGIGGVMAVLSFTFIWYFGLCFGWALYLLIQSFYPTLAWSTCNNTWNTQLCIDSTSNITEVKTMFNLTDGSKLAMSGAEFWENNVLVKSNGIHDMGSVQLRLIGCVALGWIIVFLCLVRGVQSLGKVVYVTATLPYVLLTILLVRGVTLDGASEGLYKYIYPDFTRLLGSQVWVEAAVQCFYSLGPAWGGVITMASFNKFRHNIIRDTVIVCIADGFTGFYSGLVVFSVLGFLAKETGTPFENLPFTGASLAFIAYPEALSRLPYPNIWSVLFFFTLLLVGVDTAFSMFETVTSCIIDLSYRRLHKYRTVISAILTVFIIILSIPLTMSGGYYIFMLCDWYIASFNIVVIALLETCIVAWLYGAATFSSDIELMQGRPVPMVIRVFWCFILPLFTAAIILTSAINFSAPYFGKDGYTYPDFAIAVGNVIAFGPFPCIFLIAIALILCERGSMKQRLMKLTQPSDNWLPNDCKMKEVYKCNPYIYRNGCWDRTTRNLLGNNRARV